MRCASENAFPSVFSSTREADDKAIWVSVSVRFTGQFYGTQRLITQAKGGSNCYGNMHRYWIVKPIIKSHHLVLLQ